MNAPRLNRRLTLENREQVPDGHGGFTQTWTALGVLWAEVTPRTGREATSVGIPVSRVGYRIVVRGAPFGSGQRPVAGQRFRDGTRLFPIQAVTENDLNGRYILCFADEEVAP